MLLAKGGRVACNCPKEEVALVCKTLGYPIPNMTNPADWLLDLISVDNRESREAVTRERVQTILDSWAAREKTPDRTAKEAEVPVQSDDTLESDKPAALHVALPVVMERMVKNMWRQKPGERKVEPLPGNRPHRIGLVFFVRLYQAPLVAV